MKNLLKVCLLVTLSAIGIGKTFGQFVWTKDAHNPVLSGGAAGAWNRQIDQPCVIFNNDSSRYEMWFEASSGTSSDWRPYRFGFAWSPDGVNWTMYPSPVLSPDSGAWDAYTVELPEVIRENGQYKMWYISYRSLTDPDYVGYATSPDGIHWTKYAGNPVMAPGPAAWDAGGPWGMSVMPISGGYKMWYAAFNSLSLPPPHHTTIGYATSADGITWVKDTTKANPVLGLDSVGKWDDAFMAFPQVLQRGKTYYMWYTGSRSTFDPVEIGAATSDDSGKTWKRYSLNPVLSPSGTGWDGNSVEVGTVLWRGDTLDMWYDGSANPTSTNLWRIGLARAEITAISERMGGLPHEYSLAQNYPNPFNPSTTIKYKMPQVSQVNLTVFDILGREVSVLVNEREDAGVHEVSFDGSGLASGVYFYRLKAGEFMQTKRFLLLK